MEAVLEEAFQDPPWGASERAFMKKELEIRENDWKIEIGRKKWAKLSRLREEEWMTWRWWGRKVEGDQAVAEFEMGEDWARWQIDGVDHWSTEPEVDADFDYQTAM